MLLCKRDLLIDFCQKKRFVKKNFEILLGSTEEDPPRRQHHEIREILPETLQPGGQLKNLFDGRHLDSCLGAHRAYFHYNDTWQLIINTSTTIITFLMVFLIQNTQNRDNDILHLKLDELIRATKEAHNAALSLDKLGSRELQKLREQYSKLGQSNAADDIRQETDSPSGPI